MEVRDMDKIQEILVEPFVDEDRAKKIRQALVKAYSNNDRTAIVKAAQEAQKYVDEGGDCPFKRYDPVEDYDGKEPDKLADQYIIRMMHDRYCDDDDDQEYIRTGLKPSMRISQPVQLSLNF